MPTDPSDKNLSIEKIDDRILRILNLSGTFSLDYQTYYQLLNKKIRTSKITGKRLSPEELALLSNEGKRIKGKKGRFKVLSKTIKVDNIPGSSKGKTSKKGSGPPNGNGPKINDKNIFPPRGDIVLSSKGQIDTKRDLNAFGDINDSLDKIYKNLLLQNKESKKEDEISRKDRENKARSAKESKLEGIFKGLIKTAEVVLRPFKSMFDQIFDYLFNIVLGGVVLDLIDWVKDPENQEKIRSITRFLTDHWPKLLGAYLLFGNKFGRFLVNITGTLLKGLARLAVANPAVTAALAAVGVAALANEVTGQKEGAKVQTENKAREQTGKGLGIQGTDTMRDTTPSPGSMGATTPYGLLQAAKNGGVIQSLPQSLNINQIAYEDGGSINSDSGLRITGAGPDTQLIAAQPGEIVIPTKTVRKYGSDYFMNLIKKSGATGIPRFANNIQLAQNGGIVGDNNMSGMLKVGTSFGGADGTKQTKFVGLNLSGGNNTKFNLDAMLTRGVVNSQGTSPSASVSTGLNNMSSSGSSENWQGVPYRLPKIDQKIDQKVGFGGSFNFNMSRSLGTSPPTPTASTTEPPKTRSKSPVIPRESVRQQQQPRNQFAQRYQKRYQAFVTKNFPEAPTPPETSNVTTITLPPKIVPGPRPQVPGVDSTVDVPDFPSSVGGNSNRLMTMATYF